MSSNYTSACVSILASHCVPGTALPLQSIPEVTLMIHINLFTLWMDHEDSAGDCQHPLYQRGERIKHPHRCVCVRVRVSLDIRETITLKGTLVCNELRGRLMN